MEKEKNKDNPYYYFFPSFLPQYYIEGPLGDGLFMEELSASFGDRKADLIMKMTPLNNSWTAHILTNYPREP